MDSIYINFILIIIKYIQIYTALSVSVGSPTRAFASGTIANYDPSLRDTHNRQRNPKNEERNYENYVDIVSWPYRSFEILFRRMQFGVFVGSFPFRYFPMMDYPITSGFFLSPPFFFLFLLTSPSKLTQYHMAIIMARASARQDSLSCSLKQWDVTLFSDVPSFRAGEHIREI